MRAASAYRTTCLLSAYRTGRHSLLPPSCARDGALS